MLPLRLFVLGALRRNSTASGSAIDAASLSSLLSTPAWSVRTLLPKTTTASSSETDTTEITPAKLHHLLRLSALPPPSSPAQEAQLLKSLHDHLHFVRAIQSVDTAGVKPLVRIEDEVDREELSWEDVAGAEERLEKEGVPDRGTVQWEPLKQAKRTAGDFFVVQEAKEEAEERNGEVNAMDR